MILKQAWVSKKKYKLNYNYLKPFIIINQLLCTITFVFWWNLNFDAIKWWTSIGDEGILRKLNSKFLCQFILENQSEVREKSVKSQRIFLSWLLETLTCRANAQSLYSIQGKHTSVWTCINVCVYWENKEIFLQKKLWSCHQTGMSKNSLIKVCFSLTFQEQPP